MAGRLVVDRRARRWLMIRWSSKSKPPRNEPLILKRAASRGTVSKTIGDQISVDSKLFGSGEAPGFHNRPTEYLCPSKLTDSSNRVSAGSDFASSVAGRIPRASTSQNRLKSRLRRSSV
ncbi:hypothetical protein T12_9192 [Trichinella patagoniensis]|uniref:Uncharacterized protein n=2 Tax=Trichinella TaxID=6333 RepID=A0A0V1ACG4_9BILA|nr:hypothetical protein T12_9192 [Trichinella patagoniensis]